MFKFELWDLGYLIGSITSPMALVLRNLSNQVTSDFIINDISTVSSNEIWLSQVRLSFD